MRTGTSPMRSDITIGLNLARSPEGPGPLHVESANPQAVPKKMEKMHDLLQSLHFSRPFEATPLVLQVVPLCATAR